jgi:tetratricopeptide (TPR) repeat protein
VTRLKREGLVLLGTILILGTTAYLIGCATAPPKAERTPEQEKAYRDSLEMAHTKKIQILMSLGNEPFKQADYAPAKKYFKQAAELDTSGKFGKLLYHRLGTCYLQLGQADSAEWAYKLGIHNRPDDPYPYEALRYIYRNSGRYDDAIAMSERLTQLEPDSASHYKILGELYIQIDDKDKAITAYQSAVEKDPTDKTTQEILDNLLGSTGDLDAVLQNRKDIVEKFPDDMQKRVDLAETYLKLGQPGPAAEQLVIVTQKETENVYALEMLGEAYNQLENYQQAANTFAKIIKINPDDKKNLCQYAISLRMLGQYTEAMRQVGKALRIDPKYGLAYLARGLTFEISADRCVKQNKDEKILFDDKLIYEQAYYAYREATGDPFFSTDARRYMEVVKPVIPEASDLFMHKNQSTPRKSCYDWALSFWKEVNR